MTVVEADCEAQGDSSRVLLSEVVRVRHHECVVDSWLGLGFVLELDEVRALAKQFPRPPPQQLGAGNARLWGGVEQAPRHRTQLAM